MSFFLDLWNGLQDLLRGALEGIHGGIDGLFGVHAWGWAIVALTLIVRILLLPLASKQFKSMRAMQQLQPKVKAIQKKYKVDRELMRKDPEKYRKRKQQQNEEMMALYKEHGVNPASGCLPLLLQAPIFFALFRVLQTEAEIKTAEFYFFTSNVSLPARPDPLPTDYVDPTGLGASPMNAGWAGWLLVVLIAGTMFVTQKQMMARRTAGADEQTTQQQRIMLYVMPVFLGAISINLPLGVLLYWVTTNLWQFAQQAIILKEVEAEPGGTSEQGAKRAPRKGPDTGSGTAKPGRGGRRDRSNAPARPEPSAKPKPKPKPRGRPDHLPGGRRSSR